MPTCLSQLDRHLERGQLAQALVVLGRRVGVGHDPGARLQQCDPVVQTTVRIAMHASSASPGSA